MALKYFINKKQSVCVISLLGSMRNDDGSVLQKCLEETAENSSQFIIVNMGGLSQFEAEMARPFSLFQQALRTQCTLILCNFDAQVLSFCRSSGIVRDGELMNDLMSALQKIISEKKV